MGGQKERGKDRKRGGKRGCFREVGKSAASSLDAITQAITEDEERHGEGGGGKPENESTRELKANRSFCVAMHVEHRTTTQTFGEIRQCEFKN